MLFFMFISFFSLAEEKEISAFNLTKEEKGAVTLQANISFNPCVVE